MNPADDRNPQGIEGPEDRFPGPGRVDPPGLSGQESERASSLPSLPAGGAAPESPESLASLSEAPAHQETPPGTEPGAKPPSQRKILGSFFEVTLVVLLALFMALLLKIYVAEAYEIKGRSMLPNFKEEERVMLLKIFYQIQRGDVIIFSSAENPAKDLIKRVIGLPGDVVEMREGQMHINGQRLDEPYGVRASSHRENHPPESVPAGKYYVLGDNRPDSQDSRIFHPIDSSQIKGKVVLRWWPFKRLGSF